VSDPLAEDLAQMTGAAALPRDNGTLVFHAPWEGRAVALAIALLQRLDLPWDEFRVSLIASVAEQPDRPYYESWAAALERFVLGRQLTSRAALDTATPTERPVL
jgi:nitrile hydratase accessory protein